MSRRWEYVPLDRQGAWGHFTYGVGAVATLSAWFPGRLRVKGQEHVPAEGPAILAANHASYCDPPVVGAAVWPKRRVNFMAKSELFDIAPLGWLIHTWAFPVHRGTADREAIRTSLRVLESGGLLSMFPEGGRSPSEAQLLPGELGVAMVAARAGVPVIPIGLVGTSRALPRGRPLLIPFPVEVRIGAPLELPMLREGRARRRQFEEATEAIMGAIADLVGRPHPGVAGTESAVWPAGHEPLGRAEVAAEEE